MNTSKIIRFKVCGTLGFPMDMLRYDCCWPDTSQDVGRIEESIQDRKAWIDRSDNQRVVVLASYHKPTEARWSSFGWRVTP